MTTPEPTIRVLVAPTNPGQFLACCGLLELAGRMWEAAEGWFDGGHFCVAAGGSLTELLAAARAASLVNLDPKDPMTSPLKLSAPFELRVDWWQDGRAGGDTFKTWAGQQKIVSIARAMHATLPIGTNGSVDGEALLNTGAVMYDPDEPKKTVEPLYFDARRAAQASGLDIGFSPDAQGMTMPVFAAVEFLCLIGLQRFRPRPNKDRTFTYWTWPVPLPPLIAAPAACGVVELPGAQPYSFRLLFRTKYLKGFLPAIPVGGAS